MSDWTNLEEILQDLSVAQGNEVPADLETFGAVGPPAYNPEKEESMEYEELQCTCYYGGSGDVPAPDYKLIQNMLKIVKDEERDDTAGPSTDPDEPKAKKIKKKSKINVAMTSIMRAKDVIPKMFKKKSSFHTEVRHTSENVTPLQTFSSCPDKSKEFTPSANASAYYSKYLEKSQLKEQITEDIWAKAERQMKEIEERKKRKPKPQVVTARSPAYERGNMSPLGDALPACAAYAVALPEEHRHVKPGNKPGECIVCLVYAKHGFNF